MSQSAETDANFEGVTVPEGWTGHPSYTLVHRNLGDSWAVVACGFPSLPMSIRVPLAPEVKRCMTCWPSGRDLAALRREPLCMSKHPQHVDPAERTGESDD